MNKDKLGKLIKTAQMLLDGTAPETDFEAWKSSCIIFLSHAFGENSIELKEFNKIRFSLSCYTDFTTQDDIDSRFKEGLNSAITLLKSFLDDLSDKPVNQNKNTVFIVHGHDEGLKYKIKNLLTTLELDPIILHEKISRNDTIIEKLEYYGSKACAAVVLFTPDDFGQAKTEEERKERARQNVVFEAGFFIGLLGRKNVILVLSDDSIELPGDLKGIVYTKDSSELDISRELKGMGLNVDLNKLF